MDEFVYVDCKSGHRLKALAQFRGRSFCCPKCDDRVVIPQAKDRLSDTGLLRILGDVTPLPAPAVLSNSPALAPRTCPRCSLEVSRQISVCPHCQCFIGAQNAPPPTRPGA